VGPPSAAIPELVAENEDLEVLGSVLVTLATADEETVRVWATR
jgi:hypothetical protein